MTEKQAIILRSCFANGLEFRKNMAIINGKELTFEEIDELAKEFDEAIEKQIPVKPVYCKDQNIYFTSKWECPTCHKEFNGMKISEYCYHCGQKFDWEVDKIE